MRALLHGPRGHPVHPPLTDATIGAYTTATVLAVLAALGVAEDKLAPAWWITLIVGLVFNAPTSVTGLLDWKEITPGTPLRRTATTHLLVMVAAAVLFALAAVLGYDAWSEGQVDALPLVLTLLGFVTLTAGGWIGGSIVFEHGMRVEEEPDKPTSDAIVPGEREIREA
jgi:uncharacterized membrane protein